MNLLKYLRCRRGESQQKMAKHFGLTANDICRFERKGSLHLSKVIALSDGLGITVDALLKNDFDAVLSAFTEPVKGTHRVSHKLQRNHARNCELGRQGEDWVWEQECRKLAKTIYANAVNPNFADDAEAGFDILSFNKNGEPIMIEVKTTLGDADSPFFMTDTEVDRAKACLESGKHYEVHRVFRFGTESVGRIVIPAEDLFQKYDLRPSDYKVETRMA